MDEIGLFTVKEGKITREGSSTRRAETFFGPLQRRRRRQRLRNLRQAWHWRTRGQMGAPQTSPACLMCHPLQQSAKTRRKVRERSQGI